MTESAPLPEDDGGAWAYHQMLAARIRQDIISRRSLAHGQGLHVSPWRGCRECEREDRAAWIETVREKLAAALQAAAEGRAVRWDVWLRPARQDAPTIDETPGIRLEAGSRSYTQHVPYRPPGIAAMFDALDPRKRILACATDVYGRVKAAVQASAVAELFEVVENPWLNDGQVLSIDPAAFELPPFELPADWLAPKFRCPNCLDPIHEPGYCLRCEPFAKALARSRALSGLITGLGGLGL